ncbi:acyltransferase domain-containing protein [Kitasatospora sp. NPDC101183]|uniref:acyltransferase domain-containing protein n=1 Tax=Kitasatospora sp. NPDC101183 TaxID=3364100 RepID=UPI00381F29F0
MGGLLARLRESEAGARWVRELAAVEVPEGGPVLPSAVELPQLLLDLTVPHAEVNGLLRLWDEVLGDAEWRWLLERCAAAVFTDPDVVGGGIRVPRLPEGLGPAGRWWAALVFVMALPQARERHRARGIPEEVSRRTFADLGRQVAIHRLRQGTGGVNSPSWLGLHLRGEIFQLGRLQFQRSRLRAPWLPVAAGEASLALHLPDFLGPLSPAACEASLAQARAFFPRHFPEEPCAVAHCESWLLDPQLGDYLPTGSNLLAFQNRFRLQPRPDRPNDEDPVRYVFNVADTDPADLPRRTSLERAVGDHLRAGHHWYGGQGWFPLHTL